jgi:universal stress protein A
MSLDVPKTILVPVDFTAMSDHAIDRAFAWAKRFDSEVVLMHAYDLPVIGPTEMAFMTTVDLDREVREGASRALKHALEARQGEGVRVRALLVQDDPLHAIVETAREERAGLIVMGTHGRTGIVGALLGNTAEKVVREAPCPVLTFRDPAPDRESFEPDEVTNGESLTSDAG